MVSGTTKSVPTLPQVLDSLFPNMILGEALDDALKFNFIRRVQKARVQIQGVRAKSAAFELCWDEASYADDLHRFQKVSTCSQAIPMPVDRTESVERTSRIFSSTT